MAPDFSPEQFERRSRPIAIAEQRVPRLRDISTRPPRTRQDASLARWKPQALGFMVDKPDAFRKGLSIAARIGVELVAALIVGGGLGYLADSYFSSSPFGIIIGVFLGMSAGLLNVYRTASRL
jgi:ATP synthase protein I